MFSLLNKKVSKTVSSRVLLILLNLQPNNLIPFIVKLYPVLYCIQMYKAFHSVEVSHPYLRNLPAACCRIGARVMTLVIIKAFHAEREFITFWVDFHLLQSLARLS